MTKEYNNPIEIDQYIIPEKAFDMMVGLIKKSAKSGREYASNFYISNDDIHKKQKRLLYRHEFKGDKYSVETIPYKYPNMRYVGTFHTHPFDFGGIEDILMSPEDFHVGCYEDELITAIGSIEEKAIYVYIRHDFQSKKDQERCEMVAKNLQEISDETYDIDALFLYGLYGSIRQFNDIYKIDVSDYLNYSYLGLIIGPALNTVENFVENTLNIEI